MGARKADLYEGEPGKRTEQGGAQRCLPDKAGRVREQGRRRGGGQPKAVQVVRDRFPQIPFPGRPDNEWPILQASLPTPRPPPGFLDPKGGDPGDMEPLGRA